MPYGNTPTDQKTWDDIDVHTLRRVHEVLSNRHRQPEIDKRIGTEEGRAELLIEQGSWKVVTELGYYLRNKES